MKLVIGFFLLGVLIVMPTAYIGVLHKDAVVGKRLFQQGGTGDQAKSIVAATDYSWNMECGEDKCRVTVGISPEPVAASFSLVVSRPVGAKVLNTNWVGLNGSFAADFPKSETGWYVATVSYAQEGVQINKTESFYIN